MGAEWVTMPASDVQPGDRVRMPNGQELTATRVEGFQGMAGMLAFIEDTADRWFKQPVQAASEVEVLR